MKREDIISSYEKTKNITKEIDEILNSPFDEDTKDELRYRYEMLWGFYSYMTKQLIMSGIDEE